MRHSPLLLIGLLVIGTTDGQSADDQSTPVEIRQSSGVTAAGGVIEFQRPPVSDYYPAVSVALGEQGIVGIKLCFNSKGKVVESTVTASSGFQRLDAAAVKYGRAFRFTMAARDEAQVADCFSTTVKFTLSSTPLP